MAKYRRAYATVQDWMVGEGVNQRELARRVSRAWGRPVSESHMSNVLSKSRACSLPLALVITKITNTPIENLVDWPRKYEKAG